MKYLIVTDLPFLSKVIAIQGNLAVDDEGSDLEIWRSLIRFIRDRARIILILEQKLEDYINTYRNESVLIRFILDHYFQGSDRIEIIDSHEKLSSQNVISSNYPVYYFLEGNNGLDHRQFGILKTDSKNILSTWRRFRSSVTFLIPSRKDINIVSDYELIQTKSDITRVSHDCNALIIYDNYILNNYHLIKNNLFLLLKVLIPNRQMSVTFDFMLLTSKLYRKDKFSEETVSLESAYSLIRGYIRNDLKCRNINFTLVKTAANSFHDRQILTNYFCLKSGNSFNYFNNSGLPSLNSPTLLDMQPWSGENGTSVYGDTYKVNINNIRSIVEAADEFIGSKTNRLLDV